MKEGDKEIRLERSLLIFDPIQPFIKYRMLFDGIYCS